MTVYDESLVGRPDPEIAAVAKTEDRTLITLDLDFSNIRVYPPKEHPGIIVLRTNHQDKRTVLALIAQLLPAFSVEPLNGALWIVEANRLRIWKP